MPNEAIEFDGLDALLKSLDDFPNRVQKQAIRGALQEGCAVLAARAKELVPVAAPNRRNAERYGAVMGSLRNSIKVQAVDFNGDWMNCKVTAGSKVAYYARWVEFGTAAHAILSSKGAISFGDGTYRRGKIMHPGAVPKPFLRPAIDSAGREAVERFVEYVRYRIDVESLSDQG